MSKQIKPISSKQYVEKYDAAVCPVCKSPDIASDTIDADGSSGTANVQCQKCGSHWVDIWFVTRYSNLNEGMTRAELAQVFAKAKETRNSTE